MIVFCMKFFELFVGEICNFLRVVFRVVNIGEDVIMEFDVI